MPAPSQDLSAKNRPTELCLLDHMPNGLIYTAKSAGFVVRCLRRQGGWTVTMTIEQVPLEVSSATTATEPFDPPSPRSGFAELRNTSKET
jgi:hypothetical protein